MRRSVLYSLILMIAGCAEFDLGPWGGPAYTFDSDKLNSGQPAITPRNDNGYWNGEAVDNRRR